VDELTKRRLAHNEQLFREINEARERASDVPVEVTLSFVCECADRRCTARISLSSADYRRIRDSDNRYIVLPGHVVPEIEHTVEQHGDFDVVEKDAA
jgi:hypothetical protein